MNLKKVVTFLVVLAMIVSLAACAPAAPAQSSAASSSAAVSSSAPAASSSVANEKPTVSSSAVSSAPASSSPASTGKKGLKIGFTNSYNGNTYRQTMEMRLKELSDKMVADGTLAEPVKFLEANKDVATQVQQIESLILDGMDAIIVDPGSKSGLDAAIAKAAAAKIPVVVVNDGPVTSDQCYQINWDTDSMATNATKALCDLLGGKGNILVIRGLEGDPFDLAFNTSLEKALKAYPDVKVVGTVYGQWTESVAQKEVASILPGIKEKIDGVLGQGGDEYGALQAFQAAKKDIPIIIGGNRGNFLTWWSQEKAKNGYKSYSWAANPWSAASGLYVAVDLAQGGNGYNIPKVMIMPALEITQDMVDDFANLKPDEVANNVYDHDWIVKTYYK